MKLHQLALASLALCSPLRRDIPESVVSLDFERTKSAPGALRRRGTVLEPVHNRQDIYQATIELGTPGQSVRVYLDTGSSDFWAYSDKSNNNGHFTPGKSSTFQFLANGFGAAYVTGTTDGDYVRDTVSIAGAALPNTTFGLSNRQGYNHTDGLVGLGPAAAESPTNKVIGGQYANPPLALKLNGVIERTAFSLYLNSEEETTGSVLFGGIDTAKYTGKLNRIESKWFYVNFTLSGHEENGLLDSGTSYIVVADDTYEAALADIKGLVSTLKLADNGFYVENESEIPEDAFVSIRISGVDYQIWLRNLFDQELSPYSDDERIYLELRKRSDTDLNFSILGIPFLRSVYTVFDIDGAEVALAPIRYTNDSSIVAITASGIPADL